MASRHMRPNRCGRILPAVGRSPNVHRAHPRCTVSFLRSDDRTTRDDHEIQKKFGYPDARYMGLKRWDLQ